jgi:hypothetical protein
MQALTAIAVLSLWSGVASAAEEIRAPASGVAMTREWIGLELIPVSVSLTKGSSFPGEEVPRLQGGPGGAIRLFRYRWEHAYLIPIAAGIYVSSEETILMHVQTEGGFIVPGTSLRLEVGLGAGLGVLMIPYSPHCDGNCNLGGVGVMVSPVIRFLFLQAPTFAVGASVRAVIPTSNEPEDATFGQFTGWGSAVFGALEIGFGRGPTPKP